MTKGMKLVNNKSWILNKWWKKWVYIFGWIAIIYWIFMFILGLILGIMGY